MGKRWDLMSDDDIDIEIMSGRARQRRLSVAQPVLGFAFILALFVALFVWQWKYNEAQVTPDRVYAAAEAAGLTDIHVGEITHWECSDSDAAGRTIYAISPNGQMVEAVVCCGVWKRCTVRW